MDEKSLMAGFMKNQNETKASSSSSSKAATTTQGKLEQKKNEEKEAKQKELNDAKKNSMAKARNIPQGNAMKRRGQEMLIMMPFLIIGCILLIFLMTNGGKIIGAFFDLLLGDIRGK